MLWLATLLTLRVSMVARLPLLLSVSLLTSCELSAERHDGVDGSGDVAVPPPTVADTTPALDRILGQITKDRRQFEALGPGVVGAHIPGVLRAEVSAEGLRATHEDDSLILRTLRIDGRAVGGAEPVLGACAPTSERVGGSCAPAAELRHGPLTEWWTSSAVGVHHGWTVAEPVAGDTLTLSLALDEGELLGVDSDARGASLQGSAGGTWRYQDLLAWDAAGRVLDARLVADFPYLEVLVAVGGAEWPVTVDPLLSPMVVDTAEVRLAASDAATADYFGTSVSRAGDVDGDGFADVVVGAYGDDDNGSDAGAAYVYYGTSTGISSGSEDKLVASDGAAGDSFGSAVAGAGDVDGDGYDDVVVGAYNDDGSGSVYVYYGTGTGVSSSSEVKLVASDAAAGDFFGISVSSAGDVDADDYDDLLVGAYGDDDNGSYSGSAYLYYGTSTGISSSSEAKLVASDGAVSDYFGRGVSGAGDVDGDGYDDVVVGSFGDDDNGSSSGSVYVYYGTSTGVSSSSEVKLVASDGAASGSYGWSVSSAGDVDADGYDDVLVGAYGDDDNGSYSGSAYVYYGTISGLSSSSEAKLVASDGAASDLFGYSVSRADDVDGDGYDDVVVGAYSDDDSGSNSGSAYVYYGTSTGLSSSSEVKIVASDGAEKDLFGYSVSGVGDVDGDGHDDVIVGAYGDDDDGSASGSVYILSHRSKLLASDGESGDSFGISVSGAGDVDGDGYDDVVVGARADDDGGTSSGAAYVYYGTSTGVSSSSEDKLVASDGAAGDYFGGAVSGVGDVDGDTYDDVVVGAQYDNDNGYYSGSVYVYYGTSTGISSGSEDKLVASDGASGDYFGSAVSGAGDVDGDGYDDVVVGAYDDGDGGSSSGSVYVYYGTSTGVSASSEVKLVASDAATGDRFGISVSSAGDVDADDYDDLLVGAEGDDDNGSNSGSVYMYYGTSTGVSVSSEVKLVASDGAADDYFGGAVSGAGDVDGDTYDDVVVGARYDDADGSYSGSVYVYYGTSTGVSAASEDKLVPSDGATSDYFGSAVSGAGDVDGDGYDDVLVGAHNDEDDGSYSGSAYVYYGTSTGISASSEDKLTAPDGASNAYYGYALAGAGDLDGDGYGDVVVGALGDVQNGSYSGSVYAYAGGCRDEDGDGYCAADDCDDTDATLNPGATEGVGDEVDQDCNGTEECYADEDDDGYIDGFTTVTSADTDCSDSGEGLAVDPTGECDDTDATVHPGATEGVGDEVDQDCDGTEECYVDADDDGYTDGSTTVTSADTDCSDSGEGLAADPTGECDDTDATVHPGATEGAGDEVDQDCDGAEECYADDDDDGYIDGSTTVTSADTDCSDSGEGLAADPTGECDDTDATVHPGATEGVGDEVDQDCDGTEECYADEDDDGYIDGSTTVTSADTDCSDSGEGLATDTTGECDDTDATVHPGATETVGDEVDQDCNGTEECYADEDDDGYIDGSTTVTSADTDCSDSGEGLATDTTGECDDTDATVHPGATETVGDEVDQDCDGVEYCYEDGDNDGYIDGSSTVASTADADCSDPGEATATAPTGECDDSDATIHPDATEDVGDEVDQDCDGTEECYADADEDGYTDGTLLTSSDDDCGDQGEADAGVPQGDCDDTDPDAFPGATETVGDEVDQDCDGVEYCYEDGDNDGYIDGSSTVASTADADCSDPGEATATAPTGECDDSDATIHPDATEEVGDEVDQDCDGTEECYADADGDGYTDGTILTSSDDDCGDHGEADAGAPHGDCDDTDPDAFPGATEVDDDGIDQDCDGADAVTPVGDTGTDTNGEEGCGCASVSAAEGRGSAYLGALLMFLVGVRRRTGGQKYRHAGSARIV